AEPDRARARVGAGERLQRPEVGRSERGAAPVLVAFVLRPETAGDHRRDERRRDEQPVSDRAVYGLDAVAEGGRGHLVAAVHGGPGRVPVDGRRPGRLPGFPWLSPATQCLPHGRYRPCRVLITPLPAVS